MTEYFVPVLVGLLLLTTFCQLFTVAAIKKERTPQAFAFLIVFADFCFLYFVASYTLSAFWRDTGRIVLILALVFGSLFLLRNLFRAMREKDKAFNAEPIPPAPTTLVDLAQENNVPVVLSGTVRPNEPSADPKDT